MTESNTQLTSGRDRGTLSGSRPGGRRVGVCEAMSVVEPERCAVQCGGHGRYLDVALVNNMPDAALRQTEAQFAQLLDEGSRDIPVRIWRHTLPTIERHEQVSEHIRNHYFPLDALWDSAPAAVIVTGCEPLSVDLTDEPYWDQLTQVLEWARERVPSTIASCLAAHAALLAFDGVRRHRLPSKYSGVYPQAVDQGDPLTAGLPTRIVMPHSRLNDVSTEAVKASGYRPLIASRDIGWTLVAKDYPHHLLVLMQGHPEYHGDTLLLEFRRDVRRYLRGERPSFPEVPAGYFPPSAGATLAKLRDEAISSGRGPRLIEQFPSAQLLKLVSRPWRQPAERLYANWLTEVRRRTMERVGV